MSEQTSGDNPGGVIIDDLRPHGEEIAERIAELADYGPLRIRTSVEGIPGVRYIEPFHRAGERDPAAIPFANIGSTALSIRMDEAGVRVEVQPDGQDTPFVLLPEQIEEVRVDHPHGHYMPLQGRPMMSIGLTKRDGLAILRWPDHVIEYGWGDRIETETHPRHPGISIVRAFQADDENVMKATTERKVPSLEEAKAKDEHPRTFLITRVGNDSFIVTSRFGYEEGGPVTVRRPRHPGDEPLLDIEMIDMAKDVSDDDLLGRHIDRYRHDPRKDGYSSSLTPRWPELTPFELDSVFLYMVSD